MASTELSRHYARYGRQSTIVYMQEKINSDNDDRVWCKKPKWYALGKALAKSYSGRNSDVHTAGLALVINIYGRNQYMLAVAEEYDIQRRTEEIDMKMTE